ncbi:enoyl-CoA hydratase [Burkholderia thailandensis]|nr:enoyl-CoA hydratase [Burkholderia thailandensis]AOI52046.1 enoyl-CoA hydratase [Burkholderia thailandensis]AOJ51047.1 enoyl-CoA hydratase [Burkholderia thailandensis]AVR26480.1 enoyl-CoA hydratase [Burkholderia thailandensis]MDD1479902.1 enoyl-CoA hydratase [Burkholderia thailandensis]
MPHAPRHARMGGRNRRDVANASSLAAIAPAAVPAASGGPSDLPPRVAPRAIRAIVSRASP